MTKYLISLCHEIWKVRCETVQIENVGTIEKRFRDTLFKKCKEYQMQSWKLLTEDRHLVRRDQTFFNSTSMTNLILWKDRLNDAVVRMEKFRNNSGADIRKFFFKKRYHTS